MSTASSRTRSFVPRYGIAGVGASCSPFKVDPRQSAGQAGGARPPAGMCTRQEEEEEEGVREGARKSEQERSAALLCLRSGHQPPPPPALLWSGPTGTQAFQAEGPRVANKQASKQGGGPLQLDKVQKLDSFTAKASS